MKWEHKIGVGITCTFLCLIGAVIGLKMRDRALPASPTLAAADPGDSAPQMPDAKIPITFDDPESQNLDPHPPAPQANANNAASRRDSLSGNSSKPRVTPDSTPTPVVAKNESKEKPSPEKKPTQNGNDSFSLLGGENKVNTASVNPPLALGEHAPTMPPVNGASEWGKPSPESKEKKPSAAPTGLINPKPASSSLPPAPEVKKQSPPSASAPMVLMSGMEPPKAIPADSKTKPVPPPTSPNTLSSTPAATVPPPTPPAPVKPANSPAPPDSMLPPFLSPPSTNTPKPPDAKEKVNAAPLSPIPAPGASPALSAPAAPPVSPAAPAVTPAIVPATPTTPPPLATPVPPPPPSMPSPTIVPGPASTPAPAAPATPLPPPKMPADGSSFIPENPPAATGGPVGVKPAPLPFPVAPASSPLAAAPEKLAPTPAPTRPANSGPSVTVYDEQDYSCRPGDTWEAISKQFYMTDRYAKALQRHNQGHARASERLKDSGQLAAGERVFVPQSYVLEDRYADAITKPAAAPASSPTMPATFVTPTGSPSAPPAPPKP